MRKAKKIEGERGSVGIIASQQLVRNRSTGFLRCPIRDLLSDPLSCHSDLRLFEKFTSKRVPKFCVTERTIQGSSFFALYVFIHAKGLEPFVFFCLTTNSALQLYHYYNHVLLKISNLYIFCQIGVYYMNRPFILGRLVLRSPYPTYILKQFLLSSFCHYNLTKWLFFTCMLGA